MKLRALHCESSGADGAALIPRGRQPCLPLFLGPSIVQLQSTNMGQPVKPAFVVGDCLKVDGLYARSFTFAIISATNSEPIELRKGLGVDLSGLDGGL